MSTFCAWIVKNFKFYYGIFGKANCVTLEITFEYPNSLEKSGKYSNLFLILNSFKDNPCYN